MEDLSHVQRRGHLQSTHITIVLFRDDAAAQDESLTSGPFNTQGFQDTAGNYEIRRVYRMQYAPSLTSTKPSGDGSMSSSLFSPVAHG